MKNNPADAIKDTMWRFLMTGNQVEIKNCSECNIKAACKCGCGTEEIKDLDIKYEPEQEEQIKENENAEEKQ